MALDLDGRNTKATLDELAHQDDTHELDFEAMKTDKDAGVRAEYSYVRSWFSASAWAEWFKNRGAATGVKGKLKF